MHPLICEGVAFRIRHLFIFKNGFLLPLGMRNSATNCLGYNYGFILIMQYCGCQVVCGIVNDFFIIS